MRIHKCEFCENWDFRNVNFWIKYGFLPQCEGTSTSTNENKLWLPETQSNHELLDSTNDSVGLLHQNESQSVTHEKSAE